MKNLTLWATVAAATALLSGCVVPTPYQASVDGPTGGFGYRDAKVEDALYRISFQGNNRTARRAINAYALFRAAEIAKELSAPAFTVLEGKVDRTVLEGDDKFATVDGHPIDFNDFNVARLNDGAGPPDQVLEIEPLPVVHTAGVAPVFVPRYVPMPMPVPRTTYTPIYVYTASGPVVFPQESLLVRMLPSVPTEEDSRTFVTEDVLTRLGPRIVRAPDSKAIVPAPVNKGEKS